MTSVASSQRLGILLYAKRRGSASNEIAWLNKIIIYMRGSLLLCATEGKLLCVKASMRGLPLLVLVVVPCLCMEGKVDPVLLVPGPLVSSVAGSAKAAVAQMVIPRVIPAASAMSKGQVMVPQALFSQDTGQGGGRRLLQQQDASSCVQCLPGSYGDPYSDTCIRCPAGTYAGAEGSTHCTPCPEGITTAEAGATGEEQCSVLLNPGIYLRFRLSFASLAQKKRKTPLP